MIEIDGKLLATTSGNELYKLASITANWSILPQSPYGLSNLTLSNTDIYALNFYGVVKSTDQGNTWNPVGDEINVSQMKSILVTQDFVLVGSETGDIYKKQSNENNWTIIYGNFQNTPAINVLIEFNNNLFFGTQYCKIYQSNDNGNNWISKNASIEDNSSSFFVRTISNINNKLVAGSVCGILEYFEDINCWRNIGKSEIFMATTIINKDSMIFASEPYLGVYASLDNGINWSFINNGLIDLLGANISLNQSYLFAGTLSGIFVSNNNGISWNIANNGLNSSPLYSYTVASNENIVLAGATDIYRSTNNGQNWTLVFQGGLLYRIKFFEFGVGNVIYAGTSEGNIMVSNDNGITWSQTNFSSATTAGLSTIKVNGSKIFGGANGIVYSVDNGLNWINMDNIGIYSLASISINAIEIIDNYVYIATNTGVYKRNLDQFVGIKNVELENTFFVSPNPCKNEIAITFKNMQNNTIIKIFDVLGKEISKSNFSGMVMNYNVENLVPGIYFLDAGIENQNNSKIKFVVN